MNIRKTILVLLLICCVALLGVAQFTDLSDAPEPSTINSNWEPFVETAMQEHEFSLVGSVIEEWTQWQSDAATLTKRYWTSGNMYVSRPVAINWGIFHIPDRSFIIKQRLEVSTDESFRDARSYDLKAGERNVELRNLLVDTQYYFRITVELDNSQDCTFTDSFRTKWSPRVIELENLTDIRDIGGWKTVDGSTVKQGMLYRGCELDGATVDGSRITDGGVETMQQLQIRTVIDLRAAESEEKQDMLGKDVEHQSVPFPLYADFFRYSSQTAVKAVFEELAQEDNYPLYLHCNYGMDRTGIACYVLEALLGMSEEDCYREWELSVFAYDDSNVEVFEEFVTQFRAQEGKTLQNKAENYLLEIGITQDQINSIRAILLQ